jgi:hypothetical protein
VAIEIQKTDDGYAAHVTPPHGRREWTTPHPMTRDDLDRELHGLGCHPTDIGDAFYDADPNWLDAE